MDLRWFLLNKVADFDGIQNLYKLSVVILFLIFLLLALSPVILSSIREGKWKAFLLSEKTFIFSILAFITAARWPCFLPPEMNPDESQMIAGAMKLLKDPVFWRSVDGTTSGPLNYYPLLISNLIGLRLEYASARMIGLCLIIIACVCLFYSLKYVYGNVAARLSVIPVISTVAFMICIGYIHYTSEHVSIAILGVSLMLMCKPYSSGWIFDKKTVFLLGFTLGLVPYAKLQAVPIALTVSLIAVHLLWIRRNSIAQFLGNFFAFLLGAVLFPAMSLLYIFAFSLWNVFWKSYIQQNLFASGDINNSLAVLHKLNYGFGTTDTRVLFALTIFFFLSGLAFLIYRFISRPRGKRFSDTSIFILYGFIILVASMISALKPGRAYVHYFLFLIIPAGFLTGVVIGEYFKISKDLTAGLPKLKWTPVGVMIVAVMMMSGSLLLFLHIQREFSTGSRGLFLSYRRDYITPVSHGILQFAYKDKPMAVWGYVPQIYVETGLVPATRDTICQWQMFPNPQRHYYIKRFADDLLKSNAGLFVDATDYTYRFYKPFYEGESRRDIEDFSDVALILKKYYTYVDDIQGFKVYVKIP